MNPDKITLSTATVGLLTGTIRLTAAGSGRNPMRPVFSCNGQKGFLADKEFEDKTLTAMKGASITDYFKNAPFPQACRAVASVLGDMSLRAPDAYDKILEGVADAGSAALAAMTPPGSLWPDAVADAFPALLDGSTFKDRYFRVFTLPQAALAISAKDPGMEPDAVADWCRENAGALLRSEPMGDGNVLYTGWNARLGAVAGFWCVRIDLSRPWSVDPMPDGSEMAALNVRPGRVADPVLNLCEDLPAVPGAYLAISGSDGPTEILAFPDPETAAGYAMADFDQSLGERTKADGGFDKDGTRPFGDGTARLAWTDQATGKAGFIRWDVVELLDMRNMADPPEGG